jgi:glucose/arabinose dehydrogenase
VHTHPQWKIRAFTTLAVLILAILVVCNFALAQVNPPRITVGRLRIELERIVDQPSSVLNLPLNMAAANDGSSRLFFLEKTGRVRTLDGGTFSTFLDLSAETYFQSESGLLGLAFHPGYSNPASPGYRKLYTYHSVPIDAGATVDFTSTVGTINHHNVVTEWQVDAANPLQVDVSTRREIFREAHVSDIHNAGTLAFGPDGYLYGSIGAAPMGTSQQISAQQKTNLMGKIYRIDPLDPASSPSSSDPISANGKYRVPADNPFVNDANALDEIFAYGLRNPYRFSVDPDTGLLFAGDVGQGSREEVDVVPLGGNMGWPYYEGTKNGTVTPPDPAPAVVAPLTEYSHADGRAIVGGHVYRGSIPALQGKYIFGEFSWGSGAFYTTNGRLLWLDPFDEMGNLKGSSEISIQELSRGESCAETLNSNGLCTLDMTLLSLGVDADGELYAIGVKTAVRSIVYKFVDAYFLPEGDYNEDGTVENDDRAVWQSAFGTTPGGTQVRFGYGADGNADGSIDAADYVLWRKMFEHSAGSGGLSNVPEPSMSLAAIVVFVAGVATRRTWRQSVKA